MFPSSLPNRILLFYRNRLQPYVLPLSDALTVTSGGITDFGQGVLPAKSYFISGLIELGEAQKYFVTIKISQKYVPVQG